MGLFKTLFGGLKKTRDAFTGMLSSLFGGGYSSDEFFEELELRSFPPTKLGWVGQTWGG